MNSNEAPAVVEQVQETENRLVFKLSEPQAAVQKTRKNIILEMAGQGSGKSQSIGLSSGYMVSSFPEILGFIAANTNNQLTTSTLHRVFKVWRDVYGFTEYHPKSNPYGAFVVDKRPPAHFIKFDTFRRYEGLISFWNGAVIFIGSLENYHAHDGKEVGWAHLDETKDTKEKALTDVIGGRLRQYGLWYRKDNTNAIVYNAAITPEQAAEQGLVAWNPLYIHTSPEMDTSAPWIIKMFRLNNYRDKIKERVEMEEKGYFHVEFENTAVIIYSTHHNLRNLPPNYIENQKARMGYDEGKISKLIYGNPFGKSSGLYYPAFERRNHVGECPYLPGILVHLSFDFNVIPFMTLLATQVEYLKRWLTPDNRKFPEDQPPGGGARLIEVMRIRVFRGWFLENPENTTEHCCEYFEREYPYEDDYTEVMYHGDGTGKNRIPGLGQLTNFDIVANKLWKYVNVASDQVTVPNIANLTRRDAMNKIWSGANPYVEILIDPSVEKLIEDCEHIKLGPKGKVKKKIKGTNGETYEEHGHATDALEYVTLDLSKQYIEA